jgi:hypothetical protein
MLRIQRVVPLLTLLSLSLSLPGTGSAQMEISARAARITVGGRLQAQYSTSSVDTARSQFFFRRARIQLDMVVNDFFDGRLEYDFAANRSGLQDAYGRLNFDPAFALSIGQFKRSFSEHELASSTELPNIEREGTIPGERCPGVGGVCSFSRLTQQLQFDGRDIGLRAEGTLGDVVTYRVSVTNGQGTNASDVNDTKSTSGRVELALADEVTLGAFGALHDYPDPIPAVDDSDFAPAFGADLEIGAFRGPFHLIAGAVTGNNWRIDADTDFLAAQALATAYLEVGERGIAGIEPMFRVSWADPNTDVDEDAGLLLTPGLFWYFQGRNGLDFNLDYYTPPGDRDSEWSFKTQLFFYF